MLGHVGAMVLAAPRALFALARDGFLPAALARTHPVHRTPVAAILVQGAIVLALAITRTFEELASLANLSTLVVYALCCVAAGMLRQRGVRMGGTPFRVPAAGGVIVLACLAIGWMLTSVTAAEWTAFGVAIALAAVLYAIRLRVSPRGGS